MAVLRGFPGHERVLAGHARALPQPDQLCGPFVGHVALHALLPDPPSVAELAVASGTRVFPSDVADWRPPGTSMDTHGWQGLPHAATPEESGSNAAGVAAGLTSLVGAHAEVVPVRDATAATLARVLSGLLDGPVVGVVANLRTGALDPHAPFDVGHFVVLWGCSPDGALVGVADTYAELGEPGQPPGRRVVPVSALHAGLTAPPGRGLLVLVAPAHAADLRRLVTDAGATCDLWST